jgi:hypothetical protein
LHSQTFFKLSQAVAHSRLGQVQPGCGKSKGSAFSNGQKSLNAQKINMHFMSPFTQIELWTSGQHIRNFHWHRLSSSGLLTKNSPDIETRKR